MALTIRSHWSDLPAGSPEEVATSAALEICCDGKLLTRHIDPFAETSVKDYPLISSYHLAEWLAVNWWRIFYEYSGDAFDWEFSHKLSSVGHGYAWPNIQVRSDGKRLIVKSDPSMNPASYKYVSEDECEIVQQEAIAAVDGFIKSVISRLEAKNLGNTNLHLAWSELSDERRRNSWSSWRKLEAGLGYDVDCAPSEQVDALLRMAKAFGDAAALELLALGRDSALSMASRDLSLVLDRDGREITSHFNRAVDSSCKPWVCGQDAAKWLRSKLKNASEMISSDQLSSLLGVSSGIIEVPSESPLTFSLRENGIEKAVLRGMPHEESRRFEFCRLLGDLIGFAGKSRLVTESQTYRQSFQRAFAAEFLSPFEAVLTHFKGSYSKPAEENVARLFKVSPMTIRTQLVNNGHLPRETLLDFA